MNMTCYYEVSTGEEIPVEISYEISNDGIGYYQYGSQRCFDKGTDYPEGFEISDLRAEHEKHRAEVEEWIESRKGQNYLYEVAMSDMNYQRRSAEEARAEARAEAMRDGGDLF